MSYEIIPHTADIKLRISGYSEEDLFLSSLSGINRIMNPVLEDSGLSTEKEITVEGLDLANLLVDFLNEIISLSYSNKEIYSFTNIRIFKNDEFILEANLVGKKVKRFNRDIKAATYHDLNVTQRRDGGLEAVVLFDI